MLRTQPLRSEIQLAHIRIPVSILLADKVRKLELRILLVHIIQSADIEALDNKPVTEILGHEQLDALVHKLVVLRPIGALALALLALDLDIVPHRVETTEPCQCLHGIYKFGSKRLHCRRLLLARPYLTGTHAHIILGDGIIGHGIKILLRIIRLDNAAVRTGGIAGMEIRVMRNHDLSVLADLKIKLKSIYTHQCRICH